VRYGYNRPQVRYGHGNRGGYRGSSHWARGGRYYGNGYGPTYVVSDYYGYGLRAPPRGYYWRRSDLGDFLLVAATTGVIADLILHH
jgi:Ni/Co efflux regulator RcnB